MEWQRLSDFRVVGRLVQSRQSGPLSYGTLLGVGDGPWPGPVKAVDLQYQIYESGGKFDSYQTYDSVTGFQGLLFSLFDEVTTFTPGYNLKIFRGFTSVLSATALALIIVWFFIEFGLLSALLSLGFMLVSEWLTLYGGSIYWQLWAFYFPMIVVAYYLARPVQKQQIGTKTFVLSILATVVVKCLFNGFEFISTALAMLFVPLIYYAVLNHWRIGPFIKFSLSIAISALMGVFVSLGILITQIRMNEGSWNKAVIYLFFTLGKRTFGDPVQYPEEAESLRATVFTVLWKYMSEGRALIFSNYFTTTNPWLEKIMEPTYLMLFVTFGLFTALFFILPRSHEETHHKTLALVITTWLSAFAQLSWLVLFKAHSYIHTQLNYVIWQMPFTLFGFAMCGTIIKYLTALNFKR